MRRIRSLDAIAVVAALVIPAGPILSQTCGGYASFGAGNVRLGGGAAFTDGARAFTGELAGGATRGLYGRGYIMSVDYDDTEDRGTGFGFGGGYGIAINERRTVELCPDVVFERQFSPEFETGFGTAEVNGTSFALGFNLGGVASSSESFDFVPFGSAHFASSKATLEFLGSTQSSTENYLALTAGGGFVFNRTLTLQPSVSFPVGLDESDPVFSVVLSFNLGGNRSADGRASSRRALGTRVMSGR